ncbi:hypothetical protein N752_06650 [Desulforamulus aquiferis]|nr:hypothetical protein [Desulforamulus aquiferis]RYD05918.1 hypothetical protein N752_06650 [Desulforamulus aquiferis]
MDRGMNERIKRLRNQSLTVEPSISIERARLVTEAIKGMPVRWKHQS